MKAGLRRPQETWGVLSRIRSDSLEEASEQMRSWSNIQYTHLEAGPAEMQGFMLGLGPLLVGQWSGSRTKIFKTSVPPGSVAMLVPVHGIARLGTTGLENGSGLVGGPGADVALFTGRRFRGVLVSIDEQRLLEFMNNCGLDPSLRTVGTRLVSMPAADGSRLGQLSRLIAAEAECAPADFPAAGRLDALEDRLLLLVAHRLCLLRHADAMQAPTPVARQRAAVRGREFIDANLDQPLSLARICKAACSSARALEYGFRELYGVTPMGYARRARLSIVRRELLAQGDVKGSVTDIAMRWGFWHLSQFSKDYRTLFAELPSSTIARTRLNRNAA